MWLKDLDKGLDGDLLCSVFFRFVVGPCIALWRYNDRQIYECK